MLLELKTLQGRVVCEDLGDFMMKLHEQIRKESSEKYLDDSLEVGVPGLEPGKTGPESVVLPITPYPNL